MDESFSNLQTSHLLGSVPDKELSFYEKLLSFGFKCLHDWIEITSSLIYGYAIIVPVAFYFSLRYMGSRADLLRFWCLWGYSLFVFIPTTLPLLIPVEFLRWVIILLAGGASSCFVALNLRSYLEASNDLTVVLAVAFGLQMVLSIFIKVWFFP
ncbi:hypothetical protein F2Q68_00001707 [Brassica cretica]|uniref:Protein YIP n=1 Tax=Brassica cretica TaxID=69181 RepID=A0A8S9JN97_BRACR|nr:hypothetical protein F2Q68_00001707 [Brassica cretica]